MRTYVYIDGFNLYYRLLKSDRYFRWLDLEKLCRALLKPENDIQRINYYTADVSPKLDADGWGRQVAYLSALRTLPKVSVIKGQFLIKETWVPLLQPVRFNAEASTALGEPPPTHARILKSEEKGSDVNLACHLVRDALQDRFDVAAVLTNDTDLVEPIRIAVEEAGKTVGLLCPVGRPAQSLKKVATFIRHIRPQHLEASQFPDELEAHGLFRPPAWRPQS